MAEHAVLEKNVVKTAATAGLILAAVAVEVVNLEEIVAEMGIARPKEGSVALMVPSATRDFIA